MAWTPNYKKIFTERTKLFESCDKSFAAQDACRAYYKDRYIEFIQDWCITIDPRNAGSEKASFLPFMLFPVQKDFCHCLIECVKNKENMLCEKSRDMGVTWLASAMSVWFFLFWDNASVGWGSRKEALVDRIGDPDSIFEKIRKILEHLPYFLLPVDFDLKKNSNFMKIVNPENSSVITGEGGDNIGRGGRSLVYFKDESAHYQHADKIEAALGDNTNTQVDISSVQGTNTIFYQKRMAGEVWRPGKNIKSGITRVFIMDWKDHPNKSDEWYTKRRDKAEREGILHLFYQEVDRDYQASVEGVVIEARWVRAAIDAHKKLKFEAEGDMVAGLDVADEGVDKNAIAFRKGSIFLDAREWSGKNKDVGITARKSMSLCLQKKVDSFQYDNIGVGAGVKAEINRLCKSFPNTYKRIKISGWNATSSPLYKERRMIKGDKESPLNKDFFENLRMQAWWNLRTRFEKTYRSIENIDNKDFKKYPAEELISISTEKIDKALLFQLKNELSQPVFLNSPKSGKLTLDKKPDGAKSPDIADAIVMSFFPIPKKSFYVGSV